MWAPFLQQFLWHRVDFIHRRKAIFLLIKQRKRGAPKECVKHVDLVPGAVRDSALLVLAGEDVVLKAFPIYPAVPFDHLQRRVNPPAIADIRELLGAAVKPAVPRLPLKQPPPEFIKIDVPEAIGDGQGPNAAEDVGGVGLGVRHSTEGAVVVLAVQDVVNALVYVDER